VEIVESTSLQIGFILLVMGIRFMSVRNSIKSAKPKPDRLKTLKKEFGSFLTSGLIITAMGSISLLWIPSVIQSEIITSTGGVIFGLSIPQYLHYKYGQPNVQEKQSIKMINIWTCIVLILGSILLIIAIVMNLSQFWGKI
jgi:hypothetical protein